MLAVFPEFEISSWRLRQFKLTDLPLVQQASQDPLIPLITSIPKIFSEAEGIAYIERQWGRFEQQEGYSFAIARMADDQAVGSIYLGLHDIKDGRASLGYWMVNPFRQRGAVRIALNRIVRWVQDELRIPRLELYVEPHNVASIKTAESAGFQSEGVMRSWQQVGDQRKDMVMMSLIS